MGCVFGDITTQWSTIQHNAISYLLCILIFNQPKGHIIIKEKHNTNIKMQVRVCFSVCDTHYNGESQKNVVGWTGRQKLGRYNSR